MIRNKTQMFKYKTRIKILKRMIQKNSTKNRPVVDKTMILLAKGDKLDLDVYVDYQKALKAFAC